MVFHPALSSAYKMQPPPRLNAAFQTTAVYASIFLLLKTLHNLVTRFLVEKSWQKVRLLVKLIIVFWSSLANILNRYCQPNNRQDMSIPDLKTLLYSIGYRNRDSRKFKEILLSRWLSFFSLVLVIFGPSKLLLPYLVLAFHIVSVAS